MHGVDIHAIAPEAATSNGSVPGPALRKHERSGNGSREFSGHEGGLGPF